MVEAPPNAAPAAVPTRSGEASGLRNVACITAPASANAAPPNIATKQAR
jgi:hypothetical protein